MPFWIAIMPAACKMLNLSPAQRLERKTGVNMDEESFYLAHTFLTSR